MLRKSKLFVSSRVYFDFTEREKKSNKNRTRASLFNFCVKVNRKFLYGLKAPSSQMKGKQTCVNCKIIYTDNCGWVRSDFSSDVQINPQDLPNQIPKVMASLI